MNLIEGMANIQCDKNWEIWADGVTEDANWRYGQAQFEQGGVLDGCTIRIGDGQAISNHIHTYCDYFEGCPEGEEAEWALEGAADYLSQLA